MTTQNFALIENCSGYLWWVGTAESPEAACAKATLASSSSIAAYESTDSLASNEDGYFVYSAPSGFDPEDGQDEEVIASVSAMPLIGKYRRNDL